MHRRENRQDRYERTNPAQPPKMILSGNAVNSPLYSNTSLLTLQFSPFSLAEEVG
jgi:hypothetical protein